MDGFILKPIDLQKGTTRSLFDFNNRGDMRVGRSTTPLTNNPSTMAHAGLASS